jgi:subtilisin-like proprotein convertase family protein
VAKPPRYCDNTVANLSLFLRKKSVIAQGIMKSSAWGVIWGLAAVLACPVSAANANLKPIEIESAGTSRKYVPALNEIYLVGDGVRSVGAQQSFASMQQLLEEIMVTGKMEAFLVFYPLGESNKAENRRYLTDEIVIESDEAGAAAAGSIEGVESVRRVDYAPGMFVAKVRNPGRTLEKADEIRALSGVKSSNAQFAKMMEKRAAPNDPLFSSQWHLDNAINPLADLNVLDVWDTYRGAGIVISIVDDGVDLGHEDLSSAINTSLNYDYNGNDNNPSPNTAEDFHGTACAGVAAASGFNGIGVVGVAPSATLSALRLIAAPITDTKISEAMAFKNDSIQIKSNSWGPNARYDGPGALTKSALLNAVTNGRGGLGTIFVWAAGNDGLENDRADYDGYQISPYTISVAAMGDDGAQASYSENGSCLVVAAPSSSDGLRGITTTDLTGSPGYNDSEGTTDEPADKDYTGTFGGTSSACPAVSGVIALMLEANPSLFWHNVQDILIRTAYKTDPGSPDWITNGAGLHFHDGLGAGLIDASAAVNYARTYPASNDRISTSVTATGLPLAIPENNATGISIPIEVSSGISNLQHAVLNFSCTHTYRGDLVITLKSPSGTVSILSQTHGDSGDNFVAWPFMTVRCWGENPNGTWTLNVSDEQGRDIGSVTTVKLDLYGSSTDSPAPPPPPTPSTVTLSVESPESFLRMKRGSRVSVSGTAAEVTGISHVEFAKMTFGTTQRPGPEVPVNGNSLYKSVKWTKASGQETWQFDGLVEKGINRFLIRAHAQNGNISNLSGVTILGE